MRGLDKLSKGDQRRVMSRPTKEARGRTFTYARSEEHWHKNEGPFSSRPRPELSNTARSLLVRGTCDKLSWMSNNYYRMSSPKTRERCHCCAQTLPRKRKLNTTGRRRLATLKRRVVKRANKELSQINRAFSWISWIEETIKDRESPV